MRKLISIILFFFSFLLSQHTRANHIAGADLTYVCLGANQFRINLNMYVDCTVLSSISTQQTIYFSSPCGSIPSIKVDLTNPGGTEISQLCPAQINNSTCNGGSLPGMRVYNYTGIVTILPVCNSWTISWSICCRNYAVLNLQTPGSGIYLEATLNNITAPCNNSPSFSSQPIPYVCVNQLVNYNFGASETDGDSLYYSLINAQAVGPTILAYSSGYSATSPIPSIVLDPQTGQVTFTPTTVGSFVVVVMVQEYDKNGNLIGSVIRDIQFVVQNCLNNIPNSIGNITNTVNADQTGPYSIDVCEGSLLLFKIAYEDPDMGNILSITSDITTILPGVIVNTTGSNPIVTTFGWMVPPGSINEKKIFYITVNDGACPIPGQQSYSYTIKIIPPCPIDTSMLFVPNIFTPGGANPIFVIGNYGITDYFIQIFDRWGTKVFESNDVNKHWNGNNVSDGTYYYLINATGFDNKKYDKKGFVMRIGVGM